MLKRLSLFLIAALAIPSALTAEEYLCTPKFEEGNERKILFRRSTGFSYLKDLYKGNLDNVNRPDQLLIKRDYFIREDWSKSSEGNSVLINEIDLKIIKEDPYGLILGKWVDDQREKGFQITVIEKFGDFRWKRGKLPIEYDHIQYFTGTIPNPKNYDDHLKFSQQKGLCKLKDKYSERDLSLGFKEYKLGLLSFQIDQLNGGYK